MGQQNSRPQIKQRETQHKADPHIINQDVATFDDSQLKDGFQAAINHGTHRYYYRVRGDTIILSVQSLCAFNYSSMSWKYFCDGCE